MLRMFGFQMEARISLLTYDVQQCNVIAHSNDNNIWFYDIVKFKLRQLNQQNQISRESEDLSLLIEPGFNPGSPSGIGCFNSS